MLLSAHTSTPILPLLLPPTTPLRRQVLITIPLLAATLPLEALASAFDGALMAAQETNFLSLVQISAIGFQIAAMTALVHTFGAQALTVYASFKVFMALRLVGSFHRSFLRRGSAYMRDLEGTAPAISSTVGNASGGTVGDASGGSAGSVTRGATCGACGKAPGKASNHAPGGSVGDATGGIVGSVTGGTTGSTAPAAGGTVGNASGGATGSAGNGASGKAPSGALGDASVSVPGKALSNAPGGAPGSGSATGDALDDKSLPVEPHGGGGQPRA